MAHTCRRPIVGRAGAGLSYRLDDRPALLRRRSTGEERRSGTKGASQSSGARRVEEFRAAFVIASRCPGGTACFFAPCTVPAVAAAEEVCVEKAMQVEDEMWKVVLPVLAGHAPCVIPSRSSFCWCRRPSSCSTRENLADTINTKLAYTSSYREAWVSAGEHWHNAQERGLFPRPQFGSLHGRRRPCTAGTYLLLHHHGHHALPQATAPLLAGGAPCWQCSLHVMSASSTNHYSHHPPLRAQTRLCQWHLRSCRTAAATSFCKADPQGKLLPISPQSTTLLGS